MGSEGSALTSDEQVQIYTQWLDENDNALPDGLALTGRIAISNGEQEGADDKLTPYGGTGSYRDEEGKEHVLGNGQFAIRPGLHVVVLQLPSGTPLSQHFYIHVDGAHPSFEGRLRLPRFGGHPERDYCPRRSANAAEKSARASCDAQQATGVARTEVAGVLIVQPCGPVTADLTPDRCAEDS